MKKETMEDINRIKVVLVERKRTSKWLSEQLGINPTTVSKWCTNTSQPDIATLIKMSKLLDVELYDLLNKQYLESVYGDIHTAQQKKSKPNLD